MPEGDHSGAADIREYLLALLTNLWEQGSDFNSKRPYGYSGWQHDVYASLAAAGLIAGRRDAGDEWWEWYDQDHAEELMRLALTELRGNAPTP
jgi:hypothetical protein